MIKSTVVYCYAIVTKRLNGNVYGKQTKIEGNSPTLRANNGTTQTLTCNKNKLNIHRNGVLEDHCNILDLAQDILRYKCLWLAKLFAYMVMLKFKHNVIGIQYK